jgi:hypothetical protein
MTEEKLSIYLELKGLVNVERFKVVKEQLGVERNTSVLRMLIAEKYEAIQRGKMRKVPLDDETYTLLEELAEQEGKTVDECANELVEDFMKVAKTDPGKAIAMLKAEREKQRKT